MINNLDVIIDILFSLQGHDDCAIIFFFNQATNN